MIISALRKCELYFSSFAGPTTVAASWKEMQNQPLAIAFATTVAGKRKGDDTKDVMAAARREFMTTITKTLAKESQKAKK